MYLHDRDAGDVEPSRRGICEVAGNPFDKHRAPIHPEWARLSDPLPLRTPALAYPFGIQAVLVCASYNAVEQERGRETNEGGWEGLGLFRDDDIDRFPTPWRP